MKRILITGAAGYLGQSTGLYLRKSGLDVVGIDDFSSSHRNLKCPFEIIEQDLRDFSSTFDKIKRLPPLDGVIHFAAKALVPESFQKPHEYFDVNFNATLNMLEICRQLKIRAFVHSSTCAVYGIPKSLPMTESSPLNPISPYGESKKCAEFLIAQYSAFSEIRALALRYFNPAGALRNSGFGECHDPETHLIPKLLQAAKSGSSIQVFGKDYPTMDGTCIRDFIHIEDLSAAHLKALEFLAREKSPHRFQSLNVGTGRGTSVLQAIQAVENVVKKKLEIEWCDRRTGDPPNLVADVTAFKDLFGWLPSKGIAEIVQDQWDYLLSPRN